jgi:hypothetical protein
MNYTKKVFLRYGACSHTFFHVLNREFGFPKETEERASGVLAGGMMRTGHQCGMLWGSALAVGAESFRRHSDRGQAIVAAVTATQHLMDSFSNRTKTIDCFEITGCDFSNKFDLAKSILKALLSGVVFSKCMNLAAKWAPEAIQSARQGLADKSADLPQMPISCASEVAGRMGASDEEMVRVAGFAGGMGLSGNACGALGAALWMNALEWSRKHPGKPSLSDPKPKNTLKAFYDATGSEVLCHKICGRHFKTMADHTTFIRNGGCDKLMTVLALS